MTASEVAEYLQLAERTVVRMAQRGQIPAAKVANQWRFAAPLVRDWLMAQMRGVPGQAPARGGKTTSQAPPLEQLLRQEHMRFDLAPGPKHEILTQLVDLLREAAFARNPDRLLRELLDREQMMSTGIGHGVAIPHPRTPIAGMFPEPTIAVGICPEGTDFRAVDDRPVYVFLLICATSIEIHLQLMAKVIWLSREEKVAELRQARTPQRILQLARDAGGTADTPDER